MPTPATTNDTTTIDNPWSPMNQFMLPRRDRTEPIHHDLFERSDIRIGRISRAVSLMAYDDELENKQQDIRGVVSERLWANAVPPQE